MSVIEVCGVNCFLAFSSSPCYKKSFKLILFQNTFNFQNITILTYYRPTSKSRLSMLSLSLRSPAIPLESSSSIRSSKPSVFVKSGFLVSNMKTPRVPSHGWNSTRKSLHKISRRKVKTQPWNSNSLLNSILKKSKENWFRRLHRSFSSRKSKNMCLMRACTVPLKHPFFSLRTPCKRSMEISKKLLTLLVKVKINCYRRKWKVNTVWIMKNGKRELSNGGNNLKIWWSKWLLFSFLTGFQKSLLLLFQPNCQIKVMFDE